MSEKSAFNQSVKNGRIVRGGRNRGKVCDCNERRLSRMSRISRMTRAAAAALCLWACGVSLVWSAQPAASGVALEVANVAAPDVAGGVDLRRALLLRGVFARDVTRRLT